MCKATFWAKPKLIKGRNHLPIPAHLGLMHYELAGPEEIFYCVKTKIWPHDHTFGQNLISKWCRNSSHTPHTCGWLSVCNNAFGCITQEWQGNATSLHIVNWLFHHSLFCNFCLVERHEIFPVLIRKVLFSSSTFT